MQKEKPNTADEKKKTEEVKTEENKPRKTEMNRNYKDSLFCRLFSDKERALSLYNAINGTDYTNADDLEIITLENTLFIVMKNDVAILFNDRITLYEHQSTSNPNMPLRGLFYYVRTLDGYLTGKGLKERLYRDTLVKIPAPEYYVLYNGTDEKPDREELLLSDAFLTRTKGYEWTAHLININKGHNQRILNKCPDLLGYSMLVAYVRVYIEEGSEKRAAIDKAVDRCIEEGYLREYLIKHRSEVNYMGFFDWDEELWKKTQREVGREEGIREGSLLNYISLVCKKLTKGKSVNVIANELEEDEATIKDICDIAVKYAPDYDAEAICKEYMEKMTEAEKEAYVV